jgi:hypothetical protein
MTSTERSRPRPASETSTYVYGVTWSGGRGLPDGGIAGAAVETLEYGELAALVSALDSPEVRARRRDLLRHMEVLRSAFADQIVLPLRFGTVFDGPEEVERELLAARYEELVALLQEFDGLAELRVHASFRQEAVLAEIVREDRGVARLRELTRNAGPDADPLRVQLGEAVARGIEARRERDGRRIAAALRRRARDVVELDPRSELELLRASYLVEAGSVPAFDRTMEELARDEQGRIVFGYAGPLPPHSFVSLEPGERGWAS